MTDFPNHDYVEDCRKIRGKDTWTKSKKLFDQLMKMNCTHVALVCKKYFPCFHKIKLTIFNAVHSVVFCEHAFVSL
jgi:hypothetical protein